MSQLSTECPICYETFNAIYRLPLKTPSGHIICKKCLAEHRRNKEHADANYFPCPFTRKNIPKDLNLLPVVEELVPGGYKPPGPEQNMIQKFLDSSRDQINRAKDTVEDSKENFSAIRSEIDRMMNLLTEKRDRIDQLLHNNEKTLENAGQRNETITSGAETLMQHWMYDNQSQDNLRTAAAGIKPYSFFLTNYENAQTFQAVENEMGNLLSERPNDFELGQLKFKENQELYKFLNGFNETPVEVRRPRRSRRARGRGNQAPRMNMDFQIPMDQMAQQLPQFNVEDLQGLSQQLAQSLQGIFPQMGDMMGMPQQAGQPSQPWVQDEDSDTEWYDDPEEGNQDPNAPQIFPQIQVIPMNRGSRGNNRRGGGRRGGRRNN